MPDYSHAPTAADIENLLRGAEYWPEPPALQSAAELQADINIEAAVVDFEERTGWYPFVASQAPEAATEVRYFDEISNMGVLELNAGLLELSSLNVGAGSSYTVGSNVWLMPANNGARRRGYTQLQFFNSNIGTLWRVRPNRIAVAGLWGCYKEWPADAWAAVLYRAAIHTLTAIQTPQVAISRSEDGFSEAYDPVQEITPGQHLLPGWNEMFMQAVARYRRVIV